MANGSESWQCGVWQLSEWDEEPPQADTRGWKASSAPAAPRTEPSGPSTTPWHTPAAPWTEPSGPSATSSDINVLSAQMTKVLLQQEKLLAITEQNSLELQAIKEQMSPQMSTNDTMSQRTGGSRRSDASVHSGSGMPTMPTMPWDQPHNAHISALSTINPTMPWDECTENWHGPANQEQAVRGEKEIQTENNWDSWWSHIESVMSERKHLSVCLTQQLGKTRGKWRMSYQNSKTNRVFTVTCNTCQNSCTWNYLEDDRPDDWVKQRDDMVAFLRLKETQNYNPAKERV